MSFEVSSPSHSTSEAVTFSSSSGQRLAGYLDWPVGQAPRAFALFAHCFTCTAQIAAARNISRGLRGSGVAVLRFDFAGLGRSEGDHSDESFSSSIADLVAAAEFLAREHEAPGLLVGHSLGGAAVLRAAAKIESVRAVATIGAPAKADHVLRLLQDELETIESRGEATVDLAGREFVIKKQFLEDLRDQPDTDFLRHLGKALLVLHAPLDNVVGIENATEIFVHARHPKSFLSLDQADHLLSQDADSCYAGAVIGAWADKYLPRASAAPTEPGDLDVTVARTGPSGFRTELSSHGHRLVADEPTTVGGSDLGPSPYGFLGAALASCTSMTLQMYARRKKWDLETATISVRHTKLHAADCQECETRGDAKVDLFERELGLEGELDRTQIERLLEIADRCPVHRTLETETVIRTSLAESSRSESSQPESLQSESSQPEP